MLASLVIKFLMLTFCMLIKLFSKHGFLVCLGPKIAWSVLYFKIYVYICTPFWRDARVAEEARLESV